MRVEDEKTKAMDGAVSRRKILLGGTTLAAATVMGSAALKAQQQRPAAVATALPSNQIGEVAVSAYLYAYPLISMEMARRISTNVADTRQFAKAPMNQFAHVPAFPDATYTDIVGRTRHSVFAVVLTCRKAAADQCARFGRALLSAADWPLDRRFQTTGARTTGTVRGCAIVAAARPTPCGSYARS
jgi:hypothetical protein